MVAAAVRASCLGPVEVVAIFGRRGSGKTTRAVKLTRWCRRLVVWDPLAEWCRIADCRRVDSLDELRTVIRRSWYRFRVAYVPPNPDPESLHGLAALCWLAQAPWPDAPPLAVVADELNLGLPCGRLPRELWGMSRLVLQGRHRGVAVLGVSQRPALVSADFRMQAHRSIYFALNRGADHRAAVELMGRTLADQVDQLPDHRFIEVGAAGVVRRGFNVGRRGPVRHPGKQTSGVEVAESVPAGPDPSSSKPRGSSCSSKPRAAASSKPRAS